jgi:predicted dehydrogenase
MTRMMSRRHFLGSSAAAGLALSGLHLSAAEKSPNEKLNLACIGVANKGRDNINNLSKQNIAFLCDVDLKFLGQAAETYTRAKHYRDFRKLFDREANHIDAVVVSTADHNHAVATAIALSLGKPVYCEKPLTHTVREARTIAKLANKHKVATQMGTQVHAGENYRRVVEIIQSGAIGPVRQVYNWCNKGWSDGRFGKPEKVPDTLDWDVWLGPAKKRPYSSGIHPFNWRRFWEYGSGTFGDMAAHIMDLPFWALDLRHPTTISAKGPPVHPDGAPKWCMAEYKFAARGDQPALKFFWSDGGTHHDLVKNTKGYNGKSLSTWGLGVLFVGDKGMMAADYGHYEFYPRDQFKDYARPKPSIPRSIGHWNEWVEAIKTGKPTTCNFDYAGALTENILLGVVAYRSGKTLHWDAEKLEVTNEPAVNELITKQYRSGWKVIGID